MKHLRKSAEFTEVLKGGGKQRGKGLTVFFKRGNSAGELSVGLIVSKRVEPLATKRNYLRRILYAICGENAERWKTRTSIVVRVDEIEPGISRKETYRRIREELGNILDKMAR